MTTALLPADLDEITTTDFARFVGERLWLDFVNSDHVVRDSGHLSDALDAFVVDVADDHVLRGTAWVPFNQPGANVGELIDIFAPVNDVRIENI